MKAASTPQVAAFSFGRDVQPKTVTFHASSDFFRDQVFREIGTATSMPMEVVKNAQEDERPATSCCAFLSCCFGSRQPRQETPPHVSIQTQLDRLFSKKNCAQIIIGLLKVHTIHRELDTALKGKLILPLVTTQDQLDICENFLAAVEKELGEQVAAELRATYVRELPPSFTILYALSRLEEPWSDRELMHSLREFSQLPLQDLRGVLTLCSTECLTSLHSKTTAIAEMHDLNVLIQSIQTERQRAIDTIHENIQNLINNYEGVEIISDWVRGGSGLKEFVGFDNENFKHLQTRVLDSFKKLDKKSQAEIVKIIDETYAPQARFINRPWGTSTRTQRALEKERDYAFSKLRANIKDCGVSPDI